MKCNSILCGVLPFVALLLGCGESDEDTDLADGCDITLAECQKEIFDASAAVRGKGGARMPPVRTISLQEFAESLADDAPPSAEPDVWEEVLPLLRLMPDDSTLEEEFDRARLDGVAAYYDSETKQVTVIDRGQRDPLDDLFVLAHEFVHALQDADVGLSSFFEAWTTSVDSQIAARSLVEGEATVLAVGVLARALNLMPVDLDWEGFEHSVRADVFGDIESSPAPLITALHALPYPLGTEQLAPLWLAEGQRPLDALYGEPPLSVLDWAENTRVTAETRVESLDCLPTLGPPGFVGSDLEAFGPTGLLAVAVEQGRPVDAAWSEALAFRGDRVVVFEEEGEPGSYAIAWRIRFESTSAAASFVSRVSPGVVVGAGITAVEEEVVYFAATRPEVLPLWTDVMHCGTAAELPAPRVGEDGASDSALRRLRRLRRTPAW